MERQGQVGVPAEEGSVNIAAAVIVPTEAGTARVVLPGVRPRKAEIEITGSEIGSGTGKTGTGKREEGMTGDRENRRYGRWKIVVRRGHCHLPAEGLPRPSRSGC